MDDVRAEAEDFRRVAHGHLGALLLGRELRARGLLPLTELTTLAREAGLVGDALFILHKEFGGRDPQRTADILRLLKKDAAASCPRARGGGVEPIVAYCTTEARRFSRV